MTHHGQMASGEAYGKHQSQFFDRIICGVGPWR